MEKQRLIQDIYDFVAELSSPVVEKLHGDRIKISGDFAEGTFPWAEYYPSENYVQEIDAWWGEDTFDGVAITLDELIEIAVSAGAKLK